MRGSNFYKGYDKRRDEILSLYNEGMSTPDIAERTGISKTHVKRLLLKVGIVFRSNGEWAKLKADKYVPVIVEDLVYIYAVILGDGCIYRDRIILQVTDRELALSFAEALNRLGFGTGHVGFVAHDKHSNRKAKHVVSVNAQRLVRWLDKCDTEKLVSSFPLAFLRGLFESEGYWSGRSLGVVCNTQRDIIEKCREILVDLGYSPILKVRSTPAGRPFYRLFLHRKAEQSRFITEVNPCIRQGNLQPSSAKAIEVVEKVQRLGNDDANE